MICRTPREEVTLGGGQLNFLMGHHGNSLVTLSKKTQKWASECFSNPCHSKLRAYMMCLCRGGVAVRPPASGCWQGGGCAQIPQDWDLSHFHHWAKPHSILPWEARAQPRWWTLQWWRANSRKKNQEEGVWPCLISRLKFHRFLLKKMVTVLYGQGRQV